ncbi:MAG: cobalt ECF transporter T component CbiQ [Rhodospirillales bacterium]|nr:cobalt ECF transporter T component CbiQ [Rhodospirillales bacterium]
MTATRVFNADGRSTGTGLVQETDPRVRVIVAAIFAFATVAQQHFPALVILFLSSLAFAFAARLPPAPTVKRLLALDAFMAVVLVTLPFSIPGTPVWQIGALSASWEGLLRVVDIVVKANTVVLAVLALVGTLEAVALGHALAGLRLPMKLVQLLLMTVRYVGILRDQFTKMRMAMRIRAFRPALSWHTWQSFGWLFGMLLVKSAERADRVRNAMKCRGYRGEFHLVSGMRLEAKDYLIAVGVAIYLSMVTVWGLSQ